MDFPTISRGGTLFFVVHAILDAFSSSIPRSTMLRRIENASLPVLATPLEMMELKKDKVLHSRATRCLLVLAAAVTPTLRMLGGRRPEDEGEIIYSAHMTGTNNMHDGKMISTSFSHAQQVRQLVMPHFHRRVLVPHHHQHHRETRCGSLPQPQVRFVCAARVCVPHSSTCCAYAYVTKKPRCMEEL